MARYRFPWGELPPQLLVALHRELQLEGDAADVRLPSRAGCDGEPAAAVDGHVDPGGSGVTLATLGALVTVLTLVLA